MKFTTKKIVLKFILKISRTQHIAYDIRHSLKILEVKGILILAQFEITLYPGHSWLKNTLALQLKRSLRCVLEEMDMCWTSFNYFEVTQPHCVIYF